MPTVLTLAESAFDYCGRGWSVFPLLGKSPRVRWKDYQAVAPTREQVESWWSEWPEAGIGMALGAVSGVVRIDCDGDEAQARALELFGSLPETLEFVTPNRGRGYLLAYEDGIEAEMFWKGQSDHEELKLMSNGTYTVLPPSAHPDGGGPYEWIHPPWGSVAALIPPRVKDAIRSAKAGRLLRDVELELRGTVEQPDRALLLSALDALPIEYSFSYETWVQVGMALRSVDEALLDAWDRWSQRSPEKYQEGACARKWATFRAEHGVTGRSILHWAKANGWQQPLEPPLTDLGNADRVVRQHGELMRYCHPWGKWLVWDGTRWQADDSGAAMRCAITTMRSLHEEARRCFVEAVDAARRSDAEDAIGRKKRANRMFAFAMTSQEERHIRAALTLSQSMLTVQPTSLDKSAWLFNCTNGTLDLRTGLLRSHAKDDYLTKVCPTAYDPEAQCPRWLQFLEEVFQGKLQLVTFVRRFFGYCLTGDVSEQVLPIFWGGGANGKSTLLNALFSVMGGDYAGKAPRDLLLSSKQTSHPTNLATLFGMRLVAAIETGSEGKLDEVMVKELTGGDQVSCRRLYEDFWTFSPTHKLILATNHQPTVLGTDHAIWRRIKLIPFLATFDGTTDDKRLKDKLAEESRGILRWMVDGCREWQEGGLPEPDEVKAATSEYRQAQNRLAPFLEQHFVREEGARVLTKEVTRKYTLWLAGRTGLNQTAFGKALRELGVSKDQKHYTGIREKTDDDA